MVKERSEGIEPLPYRATTSGIALCGDPNRPTLPISVCQFQIKAKEDLGWTDTLSHVTTRSSDYMALPQPNLLIGKSQCYNMDTVHQ